MQRLRNLKYVTFLSVLIFITLLPTLSYSQEPKMKQINNYVLRVTIDYYKGNKAYVKVASKVPKNKEPEEMARLLSSWFCKILYILPSPPARAELMKEVNGTLFEPQIRPKDNVLRKADINGYVKVVKEKQKNWKSSIDIYLLPFGKNKRGIVLHHKGNITEQQTVFSWTVILQYVTDHYSLKNLLFIHDVMAETVKYYSEGADMDNHKNVVIIPNASYLKALTYKK